MQLYSGIDLHSSNSVMVVLNEQDKIVFSERLPNDLAMIVGRLRACPGTVSAVAVESTYNWYWLVDGLQAAGFVVKLVNTAKVKQYEGLKHSGDFQDARHLAHLLRLGILPCGYIYPREERALRDLLRKRSQLVRQRTTQILSMQTLLSRNLGVRIGGNDLKGWGAEAIDELELLGEQKLALKANLAVMGCLEQQIQALEKCILGQAKLRPEYRVLRTVSGIGMVLALTIMLESGEMSRFRGAGNFASYARLVDSRHESNGKKKGEGNTKCGNKYLCWAFIEAAHFAVRYEPVVRRWYQRKFAKTMKVVAMKAVAHKLARACYHVMKQNQPFEVSKAFG